MAEHLKVVWHRLGVPVEYIRRAELRLQREAKRLVRAGQSPTGRIVSLTPPAAAAWRRMQAAAAKDGLELLPVSGFRSIARQTRIFRRKLADGQRIADILRVNAVPGCSEHHTGRALDIGAPGHVDLTPGFARTREYRWLKQHAVEFGFKLSYPPRNSRGIAFEPWHWCWYPNQ